MAFTLGDAVVFIRGDQGQLQRDISGAQRTTEGFVGSATKLLGGAMVAGAAAAGAAIVGIGAAAFNVSREVSGAAKSIQSELGVTADEADRLANIGLDVFGNNFADSIGEAAGAVALVRQQLGGLVDEADFQGITENAFRLKDAFDTDIGDSVDAARTLMENFGLSSDQAFDLIAAGFQRGLNRSGDFLDTIGEYSTQFANGGADAAEFFSLLESGLQGGMLGTDKAADAFKEFRLRIQDGSDTTAAGLEQIGLSADQMTARLADGSLTAADAFQMVVQALADVEDPTARMQAGAALLGSQFEDLGDSAVAALDLTRTKIEDLSGSTQTLDAQYQTLGAALEGFKRQGLVALEPLGERLLGMANSMLPALSAGLEVAIGWLVILIDTLINLIRYFQFTVEEGDALNDFLANLPAPIQGIVRALGSVVAFVKDNFNPSLGNVSDRFGFVRDRIDEIMPYIQTLTENTLGFIADFWGAHGETIMDVVGNTFETVSTIITTTLDVLLQLIKLFLQILTGDFEGAGETLQDIIQTLWDGITRIFRLQLDSLGRIVRGFDLADAGRAIVDSIGRGIAAAWGGLVAGFRRRLEGLRNMLPFSEPRDPTSPLRGIEAAGEAFGRQFMTGMERATLSIAPMARALAQTHTAQDNRVYTYIDQVIGPGTDPREARQGARMGVLEAQRARGMS